MKDLLQEFKRLLNSFKNNKDEQVLLVEEVIEDDQLVETKVYNELLELANKHNVALDITNREWNTFYSNIYAIYKEINTKESMNEQLLHVFKSFIKFDSIKSINIFDLLSLLNCYNNYVLTRDELKKAYLKTSIDILNNHNKYSRNTIKNVFYYYGDLYGEFKDYRKLHNEFIERLTKNGVRTTITTYELAYICEVFMNLHSEYHEAHIPFNLLRYNILTMNLNNKNEITIKDVKDSCLEYFGLYLNDIQEINNRIKYIKSSNMIIIDDNQIVRK